MSVTLKNKPALDAALRRAGFKHGENVEFRVSHRKVTIVPTVPDADDTLTPEETKKLRRSIKQMRQGKTKPWAQVKHGLGL